MSTLRFTDGIEFNTSGPLRAEERTDGWYVVGNGLLVPVKDKNEAFLLIEKMTTPYINLRTLVNNVFCGDLDFSEVEAEFKTDLLIQAENFLLKNPKYKQGVPYHGDDKEFDNLMSTNPDARVLYDIIQFYD